MEIIEVSSGTKEFDDENHSLRSIDSANSISMDQTSTSSGMLVASCSKKWNDFMIFIIK